MGEGRLPDGMRELIDAAVNAAAGTFPEERHLLLVNSKFKRVHLISLLFEKFFFPPSQWRSDILDESERALQWLVGVIEGGMNVDFLRTMERAHFIMGAVNTMREPNSQHDARRIAAATMFATLLIAPESLNETPAQVEHRTELRMLFKLGLDVCDGESKIPVPFKCAPRLDWLLERMKVHVQGYRNAAKGRRPVPPTKAERNQIRAYAAYKLRGLTVEEVAEEFGLKLSRHSESAVETVPTVRARLRDVETWLRHPGFKENGVATPLVDIAIEHLHELRRGISD